VERILIAGCGYVGVALAARLAADGCVVFALRRGQGPLPSGVQAIQADLTRVDSLGSLPQKLDAIVCAAGPDQSTREAYRSVYIDGLGGLFRSLRELGETPRRLLFCSSTAVYGQRRGEWVDEASATRPARFSGDILLSAEGLVRSSGFEAACIRFGGIYGSGRTRLLERVKSGELLLGDDPHFTNRVHRDDAVGILRHLLRVPRLESVYLGVDCEPAEEARMTFWLAAQLGVAAPRRATEVGSAAPERRAGSKRCRNTRLLESGYKFRHPSYREGYAPLVEALRSR
jgi:nucleoside-diphosphate-sugar epimerase